MSTHRHAAWALFTVVIVAALLAGLAGSARPDAAPRQGGDASMAIFGAPGSTLLPGFPQTNYAVTVYQSANRTLASYSPNLRMLPDLADRWSIAADGRTYTFHLRAGIRWSDGTPITSGDFEATVLLLSAKDAASPWFNNVDQIVGAKDRKAGKSEALPGFKIVDAQTFQVTTETPSATFLDLFGTEMIPLPAKQITGTPPVALLKSDFARVPSVSSGPFYITGYQTDTLVTMARNPYYYARRPALDHVFIKILSPETGIAELERGELQVAPGEASGEVPPGEVAALKQDPDVTVTTYPNIDVVAIALNLKHPPLDDVRIRQAMMYAIDRPAIVATVLLGMAQVAYSPFVSFAPYYDRSLNPYARNLDRARELMRDAHYDPNTRLRLLIPTGDSTLTAAGTVVQQMLQQAGFTLQIEQTDFATMVVRQRTHDFDVAVSINRGFNNPDLSRRFSTNAITSGVNYGQYSNPELDRLLDQARETPVLSQATPSLDKIQEILNRDVPVLLLYYRDSIGAVNTKQLGGAIPRFGGVHRDMADWYLK